MSIDEILNAVYQDSNTAIRVDIVDATGVTITASPASEGTDDGAITLGTQKVSVIGALADESATDSVDEGDVGAIRMTLNRRLIIAGQTLDDAAFGVGTEYVNAMGFLADDTATDSVDEGDIGIARMSLDRKQIMAGAYVDDAAFTPAGASSYVVMNGAQADETGTDSVDEGDAGALRMTLNRRLITAGNLLDDSAFGVGTDYVTGIGALADESGTDSVDEGDIGLVRMTLDRMLRTASEGAVAHDGVDAGNPVKIGYKAYAFDGTTPQTASAELDRVNGISDLQGIAYVQTAHPAFFSVSVDYGSAQTNASIKTAPGAGSIYITDVLISNGAVAGNITLLDGSGGTVLLECYPGINGGLVFNMKNPIKLTATTALCITSTTVTTHSLTICGFVA